MTRRVHVVPEAEDELTEAALWYESKRSGLGVDLLARADEALDRILETPLAFPLWREDRSYRRCLLKRFPYIVFFAVFDEEIRIVAFAHTKRKPGYWLQRDRG